MEGFTPYRDRRPSLDGRAGWDLRHRVERDCSRNDDCLAAGWALVSEEMLTERRSAP